MNDAYWEKVYKARNRLRKEIREINERIDLLEEQIETEKREKEKLKAKIVELMKGEPKGST